MNRTLMAALGITLVLACAGCGQSWDDAHGKGDAPVGKTGDSPADVTNFPDGFGNVATKCVVGAKGWRAFVTTNTSSAPSNLRIEADHSCD